MNILKIRRKQLVMIDIVKILKKNHPYPVDQTNIYRTLMHYGKYRTYLTNNRFFNILSRMGKKNLITNDSGSVKLNPELLAMSKNEVTAVVSMPSTPWPRDVIDGLI